ncbi:Na-translocating system protein MpsC family protein [Evansella clarkii]|uniref:Na-translocating system protein MpsC family protein n=1 Tax=Evansella clarkii TaxID=79879 RepID=UPI000B437A8D|nr:Na-translocating system protein MpsC family protein [Evansella clarkii]
MASETNIHSETARFISSMLRNNFGKGPSSVYVTIKPPFFTAHIRGFIAPMEKILLRQKEYQRVLETRDLLMQELKQEIILELWKKSGLDVKHLYADWDLEKESGTIFGILLGDGEKEEDSFWPEELSKGEFIEGIDRASVLVQKKPGSTEAYWLNDRTILVRRKEILVPIEKELIKNGVIEDLKLSKRPLERRALKEVQLETALKRNISEYFVDWNFDKDEGFIVLILKKDPLQEDKKQ